MNIKYSSFGANSKNGVCHRLLLALMLLPLVSILTASVAMAQSDRFESSWPNTDFSQATVDFGEVISGGPPRDGIPAILDPTFMPAFDEMRLEDREPVLTGLVARTLPTLLGSCFPD